MSREHLGTRSRRRSTMLVTTWLIAPRMCPSPDLVQTIIVHAKAITRSYSSNNRLSYLFDTLENLSDAVFRGSAWHSKSLFEGVELSIDRQKRARRILPCRPKASRPSNSQQATRPTTIATGLGRLSRFLKVSGSRRLAGRKANESIRPTGRVRLMPRAQ